jgi:PAS domain S-box-containing protein
MNSFSKKSRLPLRFVLSGLAAAVLLISTVIVGLYLGKQTQKRFYNIEVSWQTYADQVAYRGELLSRIRGRLGYGGVIHNFKNFVLRKDPKYLDRLRQQLQLFQTTIEAYRNSDASQFELRHLRSIVETMNVYEQKIPIAIEASNAGWQPTRTDALVKVDDSKAIEAMLALDTYLKDQRQQATRKIADAVNEGNELVKVGFFFAGVLAIVALILYGMFFLLLRTLQRTIFQLSQELNERRAAELVAKKFQRAVDQSPATIIITDTKRIIEYVNEKFCALTGYSPKEALGKSPKFLQSGDMSDDAYVGLAIQLKNNQPWHGTFRNLKKDGSHYWAKTSILPLRDDRGQITHYIGLGEDITEHRKASEHIQRAQKMEAVGLLASGVAHDFNNVLTTILGNVHLARLDAPEKGEFAEELEQIEIAAKRARHLVGQILAFARRRPGEAVILRVGELISEVLRLIRASTQPNIKLVSDIEDNQLSVHADPTRLHQVLMNLCSNAAEAIGANGGEITVKACRHQGNDGQPLVNLSVIDDGPGVPMKIREEIFTPFFTTKRAGKGTGLGLSVVASLVTEMKGDISLDCTEENGCEFKITLPEVKPARISNQQSDALPCGSGRILLVDDEPEVVATCGAILARLNYQVETFTDPKAALAAFEKAPEHYDLVITDFIMPEISGLDICVAVRKSRSDCPIIVYSAYQPVELDFKGLEAIRFLEKPFEPTVLANTVYAMLRSEKTA